MSMLVIILMGLAICVFVILPLPFKLIFLVINLSTPDAIPFLDEIIMISNTVERMARYGRIFMWIEDHPYLSIAIFILIGAIVVHFILQIV